MLDAELLAEVYLAMTRGQNSLTIDLAITETVLVAGEAAATLPIAEIMVLQATADELAEHEALLDRLDKETKGTCVWRTPTN